MNRSELAGYVNRPYRIEIFPDSYQDGRICFIARHPELPGCKSHGDTPEEAVTSLRDARELYIQSLIEDGLPVPEPRPEAEASLDDGKPDLAEENHRLKARIAELERALAAR